MKINNASYINYSLKYSAYNEYLIEIITRSNSNDSLHSPRDCYALQPKPLLISAPDTNPGNSRHALATSCQLYCGARRRHYLGRGFFRPAHRKQRIVRKVPQTVSV